MFTIYCTFAPRVCRRQTAADGPLRLLSRDSTPERLIVEGGPLLGPDAYRPGCRCWPVATISRRHDEIFIGSSEKYKFSPSPQSLTRPRSLRPQFRMLKIGHDSTYIVTDIRNLPSALWPIGGTRSNPPGPAPPAARIAPTRSIITNPLPLLPLPPKVNRSSRKSRNPRIRKKTQPLTEWL